MLIKYDNEDSQRLDVFLQSRVPELSRSSIQKLINNDKVLVNGQKEKTGYKLKREDNIDIDFDISELEVTETIDLPIIYEDSDCIVLDKPEGILTHSKGTFSTEPTVATFIFDRLNKDMTGNRAGIVHRLDRGTSGVIICAKNLNSMKWLQKQFSTRKVKKTYLAISEKLPEHEQAIIDMPIERNPKKPQTFRTGPNGKSAITNYKIAGEVNGRYLVELNPLTGRTHQIRVHMASINCPIYGDEMYGGGKAKRMYLHANKLEITLPDRSRRVFESKPPKDFKEII